MYDATLLPTHKHGICGRGGRWTLISVQHLSFYCLLKLRRRLCCHCSTFKQAPSFWCLVQGFGVFFAFGFLLTLILFWDFLSPFYMSHPLSITWNEKIRCQLVSKYRIKENNKFYQGSLSDCKNKRSVCIGKGLSWSVNIKEDKIICVLCEAAVVLVGKEAKTAVR